MINKNEDRLFRQIQDPEDCINITGNTLDVGQIAAVARSYQRIKLHENARTSVAENSAMLLSLADSNTPIYGVNTGFGILASKKIAPDQLSTLSDNLVMSHSVGVGDPLPEEIVRAGILVRVNTLAKGLSGVRPVLLDLLIELLNKRILPHIPSQGSLGSSGDLAPLAHLAQLISFHPHRNKNYSGKAFLNGELLDGSDVLRLADIHPVQLGPKEGLGLINGAAFSAALLALSIADGYTLLDAAEKAAVLSFEALCGISTALDSRIHEARQHPGQMHIAERLLKRLEGSSLINSCERVQDPYTLRCMPQILGPVHEILWFAHDMILREVNAATDNPLIFGNSALSGGNFHGQPIGLTADYLKTAFCETGAVSERRIFRLLSYPDQTGLPSMLVHNEAVAGLQSGLMLLQYTAASIALENQTLATPDSIRSLPTSGGQEDHNANSMNAARNLRTILENLSNIIAIEMIAAAQAIDIRAEQFPDLSPGPFCQILHSKIRSTVPQYTHDRPWSEDIASIKSMISAGDFYNIVEDNSAF
jgi:histidine ammonia-lyase